VLLSTLPDLVGHTFQVRGMVIASGYGPSAQKEVPKMLQAITAQATQLGANAVVDVTVTRIGENSFIITGTAVVAVTVQ